jgi:hypothetical protein
METETIQIKKRQDYGIDGQRVSLHLPRWMISTIDEEATARGETRAKVIAYLIYSGLLAHIGAFKKPNKNTIQERWQKRGQRWGK